MWCIVGVLINPVQELKLFSKNSGSLSASAAGSVISIPISSAVIAVSTHARTNKKKRAHTRDLLDGAREPHAGAEEPKPEGVGDHDADGDWGIVERLRADRVELREAEGDRYERDPEHGRSRDQVRERAEMERPAHESVRVDHAQCDGDGWVV